MMRKRKKLLVLFLAITLCLVFHVILDVFNVQNNFPKTSLFFNSPNPANISGQNLVSESNLLRNFQDSPLGKSWKRTDYKSINRGKKSTTQLTNFVGSKKNSKIIIVPPPPEDFLEISKVKPKLYPASSAEAIYQHPKGAFPEDNPKSPKKLMERAMLSLPTSAMQTFLRVQSERRRLMLKYCKEEMNNITTPLGAQFIFKNVIIDREDFLSYCPIYKAASTSWSIILMQMRGLWKETNKSSNLQIQRLIDQVFQRVSNIIAPMVTDRTIKFLIVRHPLHRLVSCFRDKFENGRKTYYYVRFGEKMVRTFRPRPAGATSNEIQLLLDAVKKRLEKEEPVLLPGNPYANPVGPTFQEFVLYVIYGEYDDDHWRPYYQHCAVCQMKYNFILRFETLSEDSIQFLDYLNRTDVVGTRWDNPTQDGATTREVVCKYLSKIDTKTFELLMAKYENDFKLFDYSPDEFINCPRDNHVENVNDIKN